MTLPIGSVVVSFRVAIATKRDQVNWMAISFIVINMMDIKISRVFAFMGSAKLASIIVLLANLFLELLREFMIVFRSRTSRYLPGNAPAFVGAVQPLIHTAIGMGSGQLIRQIANLANKCNPFLFFGFVVTSTAAEDMPLSSSVVFGTMNQLPAGLARLIPSDIICTLSRAVAAFPRFDFVKFYKEGFTTIQHAITSVRDNSVNLGGALATESQLVGG